MKVALIHPYAKVKQIDFDLRSTTERHLGASWQQDHFYEQFPLSLLIAASWFTGADGMNAEVILLTDHPDQPLALTDDLDLVLVTFMTAQAERAYEIAAICKQKGIFSLCGGSHASFLPEEAIVHFDAVLIGELEAVFTQWLERFKAGQGHGIFNKEKIQPTSKQWERIPAWHLLDPVQTSIIPIQVTRGCPLACEFCSATRLFGTALRTKSLSHLEKELQVIEELFSPQTSSLLFVDDNLFLDEKFAFALMEMLKKSPFVFSTYTDIRLGENPQLLAAAAEAGLTHIFCGLESVVSSSLRPMSGLKGRLVTHYAQYIHNIQKAGVGVFGSFILGLDDDDQSTFANLEKFLAETPLYRASFGFLTPYPGTPLYERKRQEQRITSSNWSEYFEWNVVLDHPILTKQQLVEGVKNLYDFFYSKPMGLKRIRYFKSLKK